MYDFRDKWLWSNNEFTSKETWIPQVENQQLSIPVLSKSTYVLSSKCVQILHYMNFGLTYSTSLSTLPVPIPDEEKKLINLTFISIQLSEMHWMLKVKLRLEYKFTNLKEIRKIFESCMWLSLLWNSLMSDWFLILQDATKIFLEAIGFCRADALLSKNIKTWERLCNAYSKWYIGIWFSKLYINVTFIEDAAEYNSNKTGDILPTKM